MSNLAAARRVIALARELGAESFCVCGGSRNAPLIAALADDSWQLTENVAANRQLPTVNSFVDERAAAFFALGRAKLTERPVAVITTSGTAAAELLPAAIEAHYSGVPLILITADRPARYRGTGAPQAIEQESLFGVYAETLGSGLQFSVSYLQSTRMTPNKKLKTEDLTPWTWSRRGPLHINIEFDEPLIDE